MNYWSLSLSLSSFLWIRRRWYKVNKRRNYIWTNIPLPPKEQSPDIKCIKLELRPVIAAIIGKQLKCAVNPNWLNKQMKALQSCVFSASNFLFPHTVQYVSNSNVGKRRLPRALASFPPITTNVTFLFSFMLPLSFYHSQLSVPLCLPVHVLVFLWVCLSHFANGQNHRRWETTANTNMCHVRNPVSTHTHISTSCTLALTPMGPDSISSQTLCCERNVSIKYQLWNRSLCCQV